MISPVSKKGLVLRKAKSNRYLLLQHYSSILWHILNADGAKNPRALFTPVSDVGNMPMPPIPQPGWQNTPRPERATPDDTPPLDWPPCGNNHHTTPPKRNTSWPGI